jgi:acetyl-CoA carboxylase carboxyltransferase component
LGYGTLPIKGDTSRVSDRPDFEEAIERRALTRDEARPEAVERRHAGGQRTARENIADLVDPGSFDAFGIPLVSLIDTPG